MDPILVNLAVEDDLSEGMLRRLLSDRPVAYTIGTVFKKAGFGYLKKNCRAFNNLARTTPTILLTDLDQRSCAPKLISEWMENSQHRDFLLRVAVREVEAWVLGGEQSLGHYLTLRKPLRLQNPETLADPKQVVLRLCMQSPRRELREDLVREDPEGKLRQGPAYNSKLVEFIKTVWNAEAAAKACPSLSRMINALAELEKRRGSPSR